jgi:Ca2+/Na+ antiporter
VAGLAGMIGPGPVDPALTGATSAVMFGVALAAWGFMWTRQRVSRWEAVALLATYAAIVAFVGLH